MDSTTPAYSHAQHQNSPPHALPSITSLTNGLPPTSQPSPMAHQSKNPPSRDSGTWPNPQSKHSSMNNPSLQVSTLLNPDDSYLRGSVPSTPTSNRLSQPNNTTLPSINQGFETGSLHRGSVDYHPAMDSRRSSVDSRMHSTFNSLAINQPTSPYESQNASQVSLAASLRRPNGQSQLSPLSGRSSLRQLHSSTPRIAPPIVGVSRVPGGPDPTASKPTQGFPWAFPDSSIQEERQPVRERESSSDSSASHTMSRQNSFAASSVRSSVFAGEGHLPPGQRRFEDGMAFQKIIGDAKPEDAQTTHHHSMQHKAISDLQNEHAAGGGAGNYSRTPELRVSHKLAERKRRSEMKDLFEDLNKAVPNSGGAKASKWEILTKAIEYIRSSQAQEHNMRNDVDRLRNDAAYAREAHKENEALRTEICVMHERLRRLDPSSAHIYGQYSAQLTQQQNQANAPAPPPMGLAPMSAQHQHHYSQMAPPGAMQGVEYGGPTRPNYEVR